MLLHAACPGSFLPLRIVNRSVEVLSIVSSLWLGEDVLFGLSAPLLWVIRWRPPDLPMINCG